MTIVYTTVKSKPSQIDTLQADQMPMPRSRHMTSTNLALAEAVDVNPVSGNKGRDKYFCSYKQFNRLLSKTYPALQSPLTHAQWEYLVAKAHQAVGDQLDSYGHIDIEAIFSNQYALAVHHILVAYATKYGKSHGLKMLNSYNSSLHSQSEGALIAAEAAIEMVSPRITKQGGQESITSKTIRNLSEPAFITAEIQLRFKNYLFREFQDYNRGIKLNPTDRLTSDPNNAESEDVFGLPASLEARKWHQLNQSRITDPAERIRYAEIEQMFQHALLDLRDEAKQCIKYGETHDISVRSINALQLWADTSNLPTIANGSSFLHQLCLVLAPLNVSRYHCKKIHDYIVSHFRRVLEIKVEEFEETTLSPVNLVTQIRWSNGNHPTYPNKYELAVVDLVTRMKNRFTSRLMNLSDQISLNKFLHHGHFFINQEFLLDLNTAM